MAASDRIDRVVDGSVEDGQIPRADCRGGIVVTNAIQREIGPIQNHVRLQEARSVSGRPGPRGEACRPPRDRLS